MKRAKTGAGISRRTAMAGVGAGGFGLALATSRSRASDSMKLADHPMCGVWLAMANPPLDTTPQFPAPSIFGADGSVVLNFPITELGQQGVQVNSPHVGVWGIYDEYTAHFTAVQSLSTLDGTFVGTVTVDGHPHASDDGMTFTDDGSLVTVTIRDASNKVVTVIPPGAGGRPITGTKMSVGRAGFPGEDDATPIP